MPVSTALPTISYTANGSATVFSFPFKVVDADHITATLDGVVVTNYTVSGIGNDGGGDLTFTPAPTGALVIRRIVPLSRETDYQPSGAFREETIDADQDLQTMQVQQVAEEVGRSIRVKAGLSPVTGEITPAASSVIGFDVDGNPTVLPVQSGTSLVDLASPIGAGMIGYGQTTVSDALDNVGVSIMKFGAVGDGVTDDTAAVIAALASGVSIEAKAGQIIKMSDGITIDIGKQSFIGNGAILDFSALAGTSKVALTFVNTNSSFANDLNLAMAYRHIFKGFAVLGPGKAGSGASYENDNTKAFKNHTPHGCIRDCLFYGFGGGADLFTGSYIQTYDHVGIGQCGKGIIVNAGGSDYGERIVFTNSVIYDNKLAISNNCQTGALQFIGSSIDYNLKTLEGTNSSVTELVSTWLECNDAGSGKVHVSLSGGSCLNMIGGRIQQNGTPGALAQDGFLNTSSDSLASFQDVFMFNVKNSNNVFDSGSGLCEIKNTKSYAISYLPGRISQVANNKLSNGGFEASSIQDLFSITEDYATITNRLTGAAVSLSLSTSEFHSGVRSLKFQKTASGTNGSFALVVFANPGDRVAASFWYKKPFGETSGGLVYVTTLAAKVNGLLSNGVPDIAATQTLDTFAIGGTPNSIDWTKLETGMDRRVSSWGNAFVIYFNAFQFQGSFYFDDFNISSM